MKTHTSAVISLTVLSTALTSFARPIITTQPQTQLVNQGFDASFRTVASGTALSYQWYFQSNIISWATNNVLTVTQAQTTNAGVYFVSVTDPTGSATSRVATLSVVLPVGLDPKLSANIRIGMDLFATNQHQANIQIDRSSSDPSLLLATFEDALSGVNSLASSYAVSRDGGLTWTQALIPGVSQLTGGEYPFTADNVAAIDLSGGLLLVASAYAVSAEDIGKEALLFTRSTDGGGTFSAPLALGSSDESFIPHRPWLAVNTFRGSRGAGRIASTFTRYARSGASGQTYVLYSDDDGVTWSPPAAIGPDDTFSAQGLFLPDGSLAVLYRRYLGTGFLPNLGPGRMEMVISEDGGRNFGEPSLVQDLTGKIYTVYPKIWDAVHFPSVCSDRQAGVIYVAYQALGPNKRKSVMFTRSIDKGRTWSAPVAVNDTPNNRDVFSPAIAVSPDGQHVTVEFYDQRNQTTNSAGDYVDLYLGESFDGGTTWEPNIRLSDFSSDLRKAAKRESGGLGALLGEIQEMVPSLNFETPAVAVWIDARAGNNDPYAVRIRRTKGTTFDTWRTLRFATNDLANPAISGENADPDGDGVPNLAEYALGLEPTHVDTGPLEIVRGAAGSDQTITCSYERPAVLSDIQFSWQSSTNLLDWVPASPIQEQAGTGREPVMEHVAATFPAVSRVTFFRLVVKRLTAQ